MKGKASIGTIMIMWAFTIFLGMFWYYLPEYLSIFSNVFLILALIASTISFRVSVKRK